MKCASRSTPRGGGHWEEGGVCVGPLQLWSQGWRKSVPARAAGSGALAPGRQTIAFFVMLQAEG